jgi:hypothetical protein
VFKKKMAIIFFLAALCVHTVASTVQPLPQKLLLESDANDRIVRMSLGLYELDANEIYVSSHKPPKYLYRAKGGTWAITSHMSHMEQSKGAIVSRESSPSPLNLAFMFYSKKSWRDASLVVRDLNEEAAEKEMNARKEAELEAAELESLKAIKREREKVAALKESQATALLYKLNREKAAAEAAAAEAAAAEKRRLHDLEMKKTAVALAKRAWQEREQTRIEKFNISRFSSEGEREPESIMTRWSTALDDAASKKEQRGGLGLTSRLSAALGKVFCLFYFLFLR